MKKILQQKETQQNTVTISTAEYEDLKFRAEQAELKLRLLEENIKAAKRKIYGQSSEKRNYEQLELFFNEIEATSTIEIVEEKETKVAAHTRKAKKVLIDKDNLPKNLPVEVVEHALPEHKRICKECNAVMTECGSYEKYEVKIIPASFTLVKHVYYTYNCPNCKKKADKESFVKTPLVPQVIEGSFASAEAIAYIMIQKYVMHTPIYRLEQQFKASNLALSRQTMSNWILTAQEKWLKPIYERLHERLLQKQILHADETTLQVLKENGKSAKSKSYMWLYRTGKAEVEQIVLYDYKPDRKSCNPEKFLDGFNGFLHVDGYAAYSSIDNTARNVGCLAHARRKLIEAEENTSKDCQEIDSLKEGLEIFASIAAIEQKLASLSVEERFNQRQEKIKPLMNALGTWCNTQSSKIIPQSKYGKALTYLKNQWAYLVRFLEDGRLETTNNLAERSIKPFVIGRKNWLFNDTPRGANASAVIFSLVETAKANNIDPYSYLLYIFKQAPTLSQENKDWVETFLPDAIPEYCKTNTEEV